uniref:Cytochrome P450 n=1 Tax=Caenorhabditis tropicalis TaxID=1561998 RepID=A0A1I7TS66_9PELO
MALIIPILFTLFLLFIIQNYKRISWILKVCDYGKRLPGPPIQPILGNTNTFVDKDGVQMIEYIVKTANEFREKGEKIMRFQLIGKMLVLPLDGETAQSILQSTTELDKGDDYGFARAWLGRSVLLEGYGERWKSHRRLVTPTFHFAKLEGYLEVFNRETKIMMEILDEFAKSGETVDLFPYIKRCTLDVICGTAMGINVDSQHNPSDPYVKAVEGFNKLSVTHAMKPHLQNDFIFWILGYQKQKDDFVRTMKQFTGKVTAERRAAIESGEVDQHSSKRDMNFLDILLCSKETSNWSEEDIREEVDTFMFAGHDTTATSFSWMCWNMAHNPNIQEKVYEELIDIFAVFHSNPNVFPNPEKFDPDRFLPEKMDGRNAYDYIPFSAGLRNCVGQKFSQLNEKVLLIHMLKNYKIEPKLAFSKTRPSLEIVSKPSNGIPVRLIRR